MCDIDPLATADPNKEQSTQWAKWSPEQNTAKDNL